MTDAANTPRTAALEAIADIVKRHTHEGLWAMTAHAGPSPEDDCLLCRALVAADVLTVEEIGRGTRLAIEAEAAAPRRTNDPGL